MRPCPVALNLSGMASEDAAIRVAIRTAIPDQGLRARQRAIGAGQCAISGPGIAPDTGQPCSGAGRSRFFFFDPYQTKNQLPHNERLRISRPSAHPCPPCACTRAGQAKAQISDPEIAPIPLPPRGGEGFFLLRSFQTNNQTIRIRRFRMSRHGAPPRLHVSAIWRGGNGVIRSQRCKAIQGRNWTPPQTIRPPNTPLASASCAPDCGSGIGTRR